YQDRLDVGIRSHQREGFRDLLGAGTATNVEKVGWLTTAQFDRVHGRHGEPGAVNYAADRAVELDERDSGCAGLELGRVLFMRIAQLLDRGMAAEGVVVEAHLRIDRKPGAVGSQDQRVDLDEGRIFI